VRQAAARKAAAAALAANARASKAAEAAQAKADQAAVAKAALAAATTTTQQTDTTATTPGAVVPGDTTGATPDNGLTTTPVLPPTATLPGVSPVPAPVITGPLPAGHPEAAQLALAYLGVPYVWGGSTPTGFDCSGLVSYVYAQLGISLPHFAAAQYTFGVPVPPDQLQPGDLVFFDKLDHVGIYLGDGLFIDAPHTGAFVRIDSLSDRGYAKKYVGARRI
jgi:cell wall-associated NlpC family hydrolase